MKNAILLLSLLFISLSSCSLTNKSDLGAEESLEIEKPKKLENLSTAYFGSGCFWCVEAIFESVNGVTEAVSGYAGGQTKNPTYQTIGSGMTGHAEVVEVHYDPKMISYEQLLAVFFGSHDPTTLNRQGPDAGTQYHSIILYQNETEKKEATEYFELLNDSGDWDAPLTTEIKMLDKFYKAEDYHQDYERKHPDNSYVRNVSIPRLNKFKKNFPNLLKAAH